MAKQFNCIATDTDFRVVDHFHAPTKAAAERWKRQMKEKHPDAIISTTEVDAVGDEIVPSLTPYR